MKERGLVPPQNYTSSTPISDYNFYLVPNLQAGFNQNNFVNKFSNNVAGGGQYM